MVDAFLGDMATQFPPPFLHLGGDEVPTACWGGNAKIQKFMKVRTCWCSYSLALHSPHEPCQDHGITDVAGLEAYYVTRVSRGPKVTASGRKLMYWQEAFQAGGKLPPDAVVQAWKSNVMPDVLAQGYAVTNSYKVGGLLCMPCLWHPASHAGTRFSPI